MHDSTSRNDPPNDSPKRPEPFVAVGHRVMRGSEDICRAKSPNFARRIAAALNRYTPGPKGH